MAPNSSEKWNGPNTVPQKCCLFDESESHYSWYKILQNKFLANEDENAYVQLEVFGDPAPTAQWFRVTKCGVDHSSIHILVQVSSQDDWDLSESDRYKFWTDGTNGWERDT